MTTSVDLGPAAERLSELVARVEDAELARPTPCPAYTLGDLIDHVGGLALAFTAAARKQAGSSVEQTPSGQSARLRPDWRDRIPADLAALAQAWREPGAWAGMTRIAGMDAPAEMVAAGTSRARAGSRTPASLRSWTRPGSSSRSSPARTPRSARTSRSVPRGPFRPTRRCSSRSWRWPAATGAGRRAERPGRRPTARARPAGPPGRSRVVAERGPGSCP